MSAATPSVGTIFLKQFKLGFWSPLAVRDGVDKTLAKRLDYVGMWIRTRARWSIRKRDKQVWSSGRGWVTDASAPGSPPHGHGQQLLKRGIFSAWDRRTRSVVIGPAALNWLHFDRDMRPIRGLVTQVLEFGGELGIIEQAVQYVERSHRFADMAGMDEPGGATESTGRRVRVAWVRRDLRKRGSRAVYGALLAKLQRGMGTPGVYILPNSLITGTGGHRFRTVRIAARPYMAPAFAAARQKFRTLFEGGGVAA
jgi:hypothetical protein